MAEEAKTPAKNNQKEFMEKEPVGKILFTEKQIRERARELGRQITEDLKGEDELIVICTLKGAVMWMTDLVKEIGMDTKLEFVIAGSYGSGTTSSGVVTIKLDVASNLYKKNVLVVEDIVDTGYTMQNMLETLGTREPASVQIASLFVKPARLKVPVDVKYGVFTIPDRFIVGFGLDYDRLGRNLPDIYDVVE